MKQLLILSLALVVAVSVSGCKSDNKSVLDDVDKETCDKYSKLGNVNFGACSTGPPNVACVITNSNQEEDLHVCWSSTNYPLPKIKRFDNNGNFIIDKKTKQPKEYYARWAYVEGKAAIYKWCKKHVDKYVENKERVVFFEVLKTNKCPVKEREQ